ncbi:MAG: shikimate dehydrogenase [Candidatus Melainabacteria bacterium]
MTASRQSAFKLGIIGHPIHHTLSPLLHTTLMQALGLSGHYEAFDIAPDVLAERLSALRDNGFTGLNVTIPHKVAVIPLLQSVSPAAQRLQSVNTLVLTPDGIHGDNTDLPGFTASLPRPVREGIAEQSVLILGAGGSARTVLAAMADLNAKSVTVCRRSPQKSAGLEALAGGWLAFQPEGIPLNWLTFETLDDLSRYGLIINTTPVGMASHSAESPLTDRQLDTLTPGCHVHDLIYRPQETRLMQAAAERKATVQNGLAMLVHQGVAAFEIWSGVPVAAEVTATVHQTLLDALQ